MKRKSLLLLLLLAIGLPWAAMAQVSIPYTEGFESMSSADDLTAAGWISYQTDDGSFLAIETSESNVHSGSKALNIDSWDAGSSSDYVVVGLPLVNTAINTLQITFSYKVSTGNVYIGYLTDANDASTFMSLATFNSSSSYSTKTVMLNEAPASAARIAIKYLNWYRCYVDDITVETIPTCFAPQNLTFTEYTATSATLTWQRHANGTENAWVLQYSTDNTFATGVQSVNVSNTPSKQLTGLTAETTYYARVKADCGDGDQSDWSNTCEFKPSASIIIGTGTSTNGSAPLYGNYNNSYDQMIYTASQLGLEASEITNIGFNSSAANSNPRTISIYMGHTTKSSFSSNSDFVSINDLTEVYSGTWNITAGWNEFELTTPFDYDGSSNLVIALYSKGTYKSTAFYYTATSSSQVVYAYSDSNDPNPNTNEGNWSSFNSRGTTTNLPNLKLLAVASSTPKPRNLVVSDITTESATVTWEAPAENVTGYQYQYKYATTPTWPDTWNSLAADVTHKDLVALAAGTLYDFRVRANYADGNSDPAEIQFTTEATCMPVTNITVSDITTTSAKLAWTPGGSETNWQYICVAHGDTPDWTSELVITSRTYSNVPANILAGTGQDPQPNTEYDFYVRANCGGGDYSEAAMLTFRTACSAITAFPINYGFETSEGFPSNASTPTTNQLGDCWRNEATVQNGYNPDRVWGTSTSSKHNGSQALVLPDKGSSTNFAKTMLVFPEMEFTSANGYTVSFWIYRNGSSSNPEGFKLYVSDCDTIGPNAIELGHYSRNHNIAYPVEESTSGWYQYETAPITRTGSVYLIFEGQSYYGSATYVDDITIKEYVAVTANQIVNTVSDPATEMTWNEFVSHWNNGDHFTSTTFTLMDNITVSTMVGTSDKPFTGEVFNGNGHTITVNLTATDNNFTAPFRVIKGVNFQNLKVDGIINDGGHKFCAGFAGDCYGTNVFFNCLSDVTINATIEGDGTHGGFIARNYGGSSAASGSLAATTFYGCAFTGKLLGANTNQSAGFCGWNEYQSPHYAHTTFHDCIFHPQEVTMSTENSATFARSRTTTSVIFNNCYFMQDFNNGTANTGQGNQAYTITGVSPVTVAMNGPHTDYDVSGISHYTNAGIVYNGTIYAGEGDNVTLSLSGAAGYEANHGTLVANGETFTLTMEAYDTEISGVSCPVPYNVAVPAANLTASSAQVTWNGGSDSYTLQYREVITAAVDVNDTYGFEDGTQGWTTIDADGHGNAWSRVTSGGYNSSSCMKATYNSDYAHQDYLVSPQITLGGSLSFYAKKGSSYTDTFRVYLSTSGNTSSSDFTIELTDGDVLPPTTYEQYTYDLSAYSGMGYVAIVYTAPKDQLSLYVDDITYTNHIDGEYGAWQTVNNAASPQALENLTPETTYQVKVSGTCAGVPTDYSDVVEFTTPASCFAPEGLAITSLHAHGVQLSWNSEEGERFQYCMLWDTPEEPSESQWDGPTSATTANYEDRVTPNTTITFFLRKYCGENDYSDFVRLVINVPAGNLPPTDLEANATGANTATATWTGVSTNTYHESYDLYYSTENTMPEEPAAPNLIQGITATSYDLTGLNATTTYYVWVRDYCRSDHNSAWTGPVSFTTDCDAIALPYTYGFEDADQLACWTMTDCHNSTGINSSANHTGTYGFRFYYVDNSQQCLISPEFESTNAQVAVSFYYMNYSSSYDETFHVGYSTTTNDVAAFTWGDEITADENDWVLYSDVFPAGTKYVALKHTSDDAFYLYVDDFSFQPVFTKTIAAVGEENWEGGKGGYYFIASPVAEPVTPNEDNGFIVGDYDLYYFSQTGDNEDNEWINFKDVTLGSFDIVNGKGYLYASKAGTTLTFTGTPGTNGTVTLDDYDATANWAGWNLVGNPFAQTAYINMPFYTMDGGDEYVNHEAGSAIDAMQGVLVHVEDQTITSLTFTTEAPAVNSSKLNMNLRSNNKQLDNAILVFGGDQQLGKMTFRPNSSKIFMPVEGKDYAITTAESNMGEMPVSFKAENNGTYSLSFTSEEVTFAYLHLIDNMTGNDVNLLETPSYTFDARTTDYESRFKLVFATGNNSNDGNFAFFSNGSFVINNDGEATLQVVDVTGRIIKNETINGCANVNVNVNAAPGVYMLRLVNGDNVKVQKVVVR